MGTKEARTPVHEHLLGPQACDWHLANITHSQENIRGFLVEEIQTQRSGLLEVTQNVIVRPVIQVSLCQGHFPNSLRITSMPT